MYVLSEKLMVHTVKCLGMVNETDKYYIMHFLTTSDSSSDTGDFTSLLSFTKLHKSIVKLLLRNNRGIDYRGINRGINNLTYAIFGKSW